VLERAHLTHLSSFHLGRSVLQRQAVRLQNIARERYIDKAAQTLCAIAQAEPQLSRDALLDEAQTRMLEAIAALRQMPMRGWRRDSRRTGRNGPPTLALAPLHGRVVCAYHLKPGRFTA
jgi:hypothetical protein